mmetsp:Transcript_12623/g.23664  ORF Transcript_12623/g.23664 Transcript_12623/m.23664 type:complete len:657 (-) Transcript_12623:208-2178(-)
MMKAKGPKFETCLFGPSSKLIPIKAYSSKCKEENANEALPVQVSKDEVEEKTDRVDDGTTIGDADLDTTVVKNDVCTPPQTPSKDKQPPSRPVKTVSSKKRTTQRGDGSVESGTSISAEEDYSHTINLQELRRLSSQGVPNDCSLRPIAWRVLLGYLPLDLSKWQTVLDRDRALYYNLVHDLFVPSDDHPFEEEGRKLRGRGFDVEGISLRGSPNSSPSKDGGIKNIKGALEAMGNLLDIVQDEEEIEEMAENVFEIPENVREQWKKSGRDPESLIAGMGGKRSKSSVLSRHFNALLVTNNDTASTQTNDEKLAAKAEEALSLGGEIEGTFDPIWRHFLENATLLDEIRKDVVRTHPDLNFFLESNDHIGLRRYAAIERILFVWAKLNKGVRYVQGMNEIVGTLYFVLANDDNEEWACEAEADTYFLFNTLMVEMRDIFVPDLDEADTGIQGRMTNMLSLLSLHDPQVRSHLDDCGIDPGFYSIRWLTTLLSREFLLSDTIRLWDSMFASTHKDNFMRYVCVCMVMIIREELLEGDFGTCLKLLQSYPPTDVEKLLESSRALWIYESQVTLACHKGGISLNHALTTIAPPPAVIMAYGLPGGFAIDQIERMRQDMMQAKSSLGRNRGGLRKVTSRSYSNASSNSTKSFFGGLFNKK